MKKLIYIFAGALFFSASAVYAQTDSVMSTNGSGVKKSTTSSTSSPYQSGSGNQFQGMTKVKSSDLPSSLQQTLKSSQYSGWENGPVYKSSTGDQYSFQLGQGQDAKTYNFDKSGKAISNPTSKP